jgi:hypothetical protein
MVALAAHGRVLDFHSDIRLAPSGEVTVTERITAQTEQGAYTLVRDLPPGAKVVDVVRNGHPVTHVIEGDRLCRPGATSTSSPTACRARCASWAAWTSCAGR